MKAGFPIGFYVLGALAAAAAIALTWSVGRELISGISRGARSGQVSRARDPFWYWLVIILQCAAIAGFGFVAWLVVAVSKL